MALEVAYFQATVVRKKPMEPCIGGDTFVAELGSQQSLGIPHAEDLALGVYFIVVKVGLTRKRILIFLLASSTVQFCHIKWQPRGTHRTIWEVKEWFGKMSSYHQGEEMWIKAMGISFSHIKIF